MGNICGKTESEPDARAGRRLGSAPPTGPKTAPVPKKVGGPPRTLGSGGGGDSGSDPGDARRKAAEAAEVSLLAPLPSFILLKTLLFEVHVTHHQGSRPL